MIIDIMWWVKYLSIRLTVISDGLFSNHLLFAMAEESLLYRLDLLFLFRFVINDPHTLWINVQADGLADPLDLSAVRRDVQLDAVNVDHVFYTDTEI